MNVQRLVNILSTNRADDGPGVQHIVNTVVKPSCQGHETQMFLGPNKEPLAYVAIVGQSDTLFSCHMDTCERWDNQLTRKVKFGANSILKSDGKHVLGADDGAGMAILLHMIDRKIPGTYIFHYSEETGGKSARAMAQYHTDWLMQFKRCIAFDRGGKDEIITHQGGDKGASDEFAEALSLALSDDDYILAGSPDGVYTDNKEYFELQAEIVNVSIGYTAQHGPHETLDLSYLAWLAERCTQIDWESLPTVREPGDLGERTWGGFGQFQGFPRGNASDYDVNLYGPSCTNDLWDMEYSDMVNWIKKADPLDVADLMCDLMEEAHKAWKPRTKAKTTSKIIPFNPQPEISHNDKPFDPWDGYGGDVSYGKLKVGML